MVFSCANCEAKYRIDDQLVAGRTIRYTCRKCGQAHLLSDPAISNDPVVPVGPPQVDASRRQVAGPQPTRVPGTAPAPLPRPAPAPGPTRFRADTPATQRPAASSRPDADVVLAPSWPTPASPDDAAAGAVPAQSIAPPAQATAATDVRDFGDLVAGPGTPARPRSPRRRGRVALFAVLAILAAAACGAAWWWYDGYAATPADMPSVEAVPVVPVAPAPRPPAPRPASVAVPRPQPVPQPAAVPQPVPVPVPVPATAPASSPGVDASAQAMDTFLKQQHGRFLECKALMKTPTESTVKVRLDFAVAPDGGVEGIRVEAMDGVRDMPLVDCVRAVAQEWRFAASGQRRAFTRLLGL